MKPKNSSNTSNHTSEEAVEEEITCPSCGGKAKTTRVHVDVPFFNEVLLVTVKCGNCNLRVSDVVSMRFGKPTRYTLQVAEPSDLSSKVIRSVTSTIRIPELGAVLEPGPAAQPFITNVEGVLHRFLDIAQTLKNWSTTPQETRKCEQAIQSIQKAIDGHLKFTIILEDPLGNGMIIPQDQAKIKVEELSEKEASRLKMGPYILLKPRKTSEPQQDL